MSICDIKFKNPNFFILIGLFITQILDSQSFNLNFTAYNPTTKLPANWSTTFDDTMFDVSFDHTSHLLTIKGFHERDKKSSSCFYMTGCSNLEGLEPGDSISSFVRMSANAPGGAMATWLRLDYSDGTKDLAAPGGSIAEEIAQRSIGNSITVLKQVENVCFGFYINGSGSWTTDGWDLSVNGVSMNEENFDEESWQDFQTDVKPYIHAYKNKEELTLILKNIKEMRQSGIVAIGEQTHGVSGITDIRKMLIEILSEDDRALNMCFETDFANTAIINAMLKSGCSQEEIMSIVWANGSWPFYTTQFLDLVTYFNSKQPKGHVYGFHKPKNDSIQRLKKYAANETEWCKSSPPSEDVVYEALKWSKNKGLDEGFHVWEREKANLILTHQKSGESLLINAHNAHVSKYGISLGHNLYLNDPENYYNIAYSFKKASFWAKNGNEMKVEHISAHPQFSAEYISNTTDAFVFDIRAFRNSPKFTKWKNHMFTMIDVGAVMRSPTGEYNSFKLLQNYDLFICADTEKPSTKYEE